MVFCPIRTCSRTGANSLICSRWQPSAAKLAHGVKVVVMLMVDCAMMDLLFWVVSLGIGMVHHALFRNSLASNGIVPLIGAKIRCQTTILLKSTRIIPDHRVVVPFTVVQRE